jgi:hypothetical protein
LHLGEYILPESLPSQFQVKVETRTVYPHTMESGAVAVTRDQFFWSLPTSNTGVEADPDA